MLFGGCGPASDLIPRYDLIKLGVGRRRMALGPGEHFRSAGDQVSTEAVHNHSQSLYDGSLNGRIVACRSYR